MFIKELNYLDNIKNILTSFSTLCKIGQSENTISIREIKSPNRTQLMAHVRNPRLIKCFIVINIYHKIKHLTIYLDQDLREKSLDQYYKGKYYVIKGEEQFTHFYEQLTPILLKHKII